MEVAALILSAQTGTVITAAKLMGTEEQENAAQEAFAEADAEKLIARIHSSLNA